MIDKNYPLDALSQTLDALSKIHAREQRDPTISEYQVQRTAVVVLANSAQDKRSVDRISYITRFRAAGSAVRTVKTSVTGPATNRRVRVYRCTDSCGKPLDNPEELNDARWLLLPCSNEMSKQGDGILLYFSPPLQQGCEYELRRTEDVVGAMKELSDNRREYVSNHNQHGAPVQHADIVIGICNRIKVLTSTSDGARDLKQSDGVRELSQKEVDEHYHWATGGTTENWHGFRREVLPTGELFRVNIWRQP